MGLERPDGWQRAMPSQCSAAIRVDKLCHSSWKTTRYGPPTGDGARNLIGVRVDIGGDLRLQRPPPAFSGPVLDDLNQQRRTARRPGYLIPAQDYREHGRTPDQ